jgi:hypothetical protein
MVCLKPTNLYDLPYRILDKSNIFCKSLRNWEFLKKLKVYLLKILVLNICSCALSACSARNVSS